MSHLLPAPVLESRIQQRFPLGPFLVCEGKWVVFSRGQCSGDGLFSRALKHRHVEGEGGISADGNEIDSLSAASPGWIKKGDGHVSLLSDKQNQRCRSQEDLSNDDLCPLVAPKRCLFWMQHHSIIQPTSCEVGVKHCAVAMHTQQHHGVWLTDDLRAASLCVWPCLNSSKFCSFSNSSVKRLTS